MNCKIDAVQRSFTLGTRGCFSRAAGIFGVGYKDLTETGNRARKVSGTQGKGVLNRRTFNAVFFRVQK